MINIKKVIKINREKALIVIIALILIALDGSYVYANFFSEDYEYVVKFDQEKENKTIAECAACHSSGQAPVIAMETIDRNACFNCHQEGVKFLARPSPEVHLYHEGNASILPGIGSDYIDRHKKVSGSCDNCHIWTEGQTLDCRRCHVIGDHIDKNKNNACLSCHRSVDNPFKHPSIRENLQTHNIFGNLSCTMCHSPDKIGLQMANSISIPITAPSKLCRQCHFQIYNDWSSKKHFVVVECTICHNPHSPKVTMNDLNITTEKVVQEKTTIEKKKTEKKGESIIDVNQKSYYEQEREILR